MASGTKNGRKVLYKAKKRKHVTIILHVNSNKSNILNASNSDYDKITLKFTYSTVQNGSS